MMLLTALSSGGLIGLWQRLLLATVFLWHVVLSLQRLKLLGIQQETAAQ